MFGQETFDNYTRHGRHRHGFGRPDFFEARGERGEGFGRFGRGRHHHGERERMFDAGDLKLAVLKLLSEEPSYGYQLIKRLEERLGGGYTPSAGVIYPTLTLLEEEGLTTSTTEENKKVYSVTAEGLEFLDANRGKVDELFERLDELGSGFRRGRSPEIVKAFRNLRAALSAKVVRGNLTQEKVTRIAEIIETAAKSIDEL